MKLYIEIFKLVIRKFIFRQNNGKIIKKFSENMGVGYIKLAQILAMQNFGNLFTEEDRKKLSSICDNSKPIAYKKIEKILKKEYQDNVENIFSMISPYPSGSASISQVHKALLKNGEVVALKIKRTDITKHLEKDIKQMRKVLKRFGGFFGFKNFVGGEYALNLYLEWIYQETDFEKEKENILKYQKFASSVNGKIESAKDIKIPKVYPEYCTQNIIVMEFIEEPTLNHITLTEENKERIWKSLNSYLGLSFYALLHNQPIIFHGDPHGGNIYLDQNDNIGFLDMGLIFELSPAEIKLIRQLFLNAYLNNTEELTKLLIQNSIYTTFNKEELQKEITLCCQKIKDIPVTSYFIEMVNVFIKYDIKPPEILFKMAKAFMCLNGINVFSENNKTTSELLKKQILEFYIEQNVSDLKSFTKESLLFLPKLIHNICEKGLVKGLTEQAESLESIMNVTQKNIKNVQEMLKIMKEKIN